MPGFSQSLQGRDLGHLRIIAEAWGITLAAGDARLALQQLEVQVLDPQVVRRFIGTLPADALTALRSLAESGGKLPWPLFTRRFGVVREIGAARRDREQAYLQPASPAEVLWYRALTARSFFDTTTGPEEFAYIPDDLLPLLPFKEAKLVEPFGRPAAQEERQHLIPVSGRILDHATTLLAALRIPLTEAEIEKAASYWVTGPLALSPLPLAPSPLKELLSTAGLLDAAGSPLPEPARQFLEAERGQAILQLYQSWIRSETFDELRLIPHIRMEGDWKNDPIRARSVVLSFLSSVPRKTWWSLNALIADVQKREPDFQRPAGDYDSWFIRDLRTGEFLRGYEHWNEVDGLLVRAFITGPLHWLGLLDLASPDPDSPAAAFRISRLAEALLSEKPPAGFPEEKGTLTASSDGRLVVQRSVSRALRYQAARFCEWEKETDESYRYRITPGSLERARAQGLLVAHLLALYKRAGQTIPPSLLKALERWEQRGSEARFEHALVLRLASPEVLQALRASKAGRFLGDPLGPTAVIVKEGAMEKVLLALSELGYLGTEAPEISAGPGTKQQAPEQEPHLLPHPAGPRGKRPAKKRQVEGGGT